MAHLYIHIPFCKKKCSYCNFHFSTSLKQKDEMILAILKEIRLRKKEIKSSLNTIYFGGGTPSILSEKELNLIFNEIYKLFKVSDNPEITLEANPDDLDKEYLSILQKSPINRLSIGVQSFFDSDLKLMRRIHNGKMSENAIKEAQNHGFKNITIDLIYGSPTTTHKMWEENLQKTIELNIPHISSYALTVEQKTILQHQIIHQKTENIDENKQQLQFNFMVDFLTKNGFKHYEISNFGKPDYISRHNSSYWLGKTYVGIGPSAHSFDGKNRSWNINNNTKYIKAIKENQLPLEIEHLTEKDRINELSMLGLRTEYGINLNKINTEFSTKLVTAWMKLLEKQLDENKLYLEDNRVYLSPNYRFFADGIASELFIV